MNKRGLIKFVFVLNAILISLYFMITTDYIGVNSIFNILFIIDFLIAITIFMFYYKKNIKRFKFIYDVILMLLIVFSVLCLSYFFYAQFTCFFDISCGIDYETAFAALYPIFLFTMLLFGIKDIFNKTNKQNDIITIIVSILIIVIHLRYYLDPNFAHRFIENDLYIQTSYYFVTQNYVYFILMYLVTLIHYRVNKVL